MVLGALRPEERLSGNSDFVSAKTVLDAGDRDDQNEPRMRLMTLTGKLMTLTEKKPKYVPDTK